MEMLATLKKELKYAKNAQMISDAELDLYSAFLLCFEKQGPLHKHLVETKVKPLLYKKYGEDIVEEAWRDLVSCGKVKEVDNKYICEK